MVLRIAYTMFDENSPLHIRCSVFCPLNLSIGKVVFEEFV